MADNFESKMNHSRTNSSAKRFGKAPPPSCNIGIKSTTFVISSPFFASWIMVNQVLERILGLIFDGEEPNRGSMKLMFFLSIADCLRGSDGADTRRLTVLELSFGSDDVEVPLAFVVTFWVVVLSGSVKRSGSKIVSSPKRSSISTFGVFLCTFRVKFKLMVSSYIDENDEPTDVKWMARLPEMDEPEEKRLRL